MVQNIKIMENVPSSLINDELAYARSTNKLYIGVNGTVKELLNMYIGREQEVKKFLDDINDYLNKIKDQIALYEQGILEKVNNLLREFSNNNTGDRDALLSEIEKLRDQIKNLQLVLNQKLNSNEFNAQQLLNMIKTVDGPDSGLDADLLDGHHASDFVTYDYVDASINSKLAAYRLVKDSYTKGEVDAKVMSRVQEVAIVNGKATLDLSLTNYFYITVTEPSFTIEAINRPVVNFNGHYTNIYYVELYHKVKATSITWPRGGPNGTSAPKWNKQRDPVAGTSLFTEGRTDVVAFMDNIYSFKALWVYKEVLTVHWDGT